MKSFLSKYSDKIWGVLSGFDRLIFRGTIRELMYEQGMSIYLSTRGILLKEFKNYATYYTEELKYNIQQDAKKQNRPFIYLQKPGQSKEKLAQKIAQEDQITNGLICVLYALEPGGSYKIIGNRATEKLQIKHYSTKYLNFYYYWMDPKFGLMHGRIGSWFPFNLQFYINGREWLKRQMEQKQLSFYKNDNCFTWIEDLDSANVLSQKQVEHDWKETLDKYSKRIALIHDEIFPFECQYYWTLAQSEWASDIIFKDRQSLELIYSDLVRHSMITFNCKDVLRFLGKQLTVANNVHGSFHGEVISDYKERIEGVRVKHSVNSNSVKMYDKAGSVLRIEATINNPNEFKAFRPHKATDEHKWQPMRKSIADIERRVEVSQGMINRHLDALSHVNVSKKITNILSSVALPITENKYKIRGLDPFIKDAKILDIISNGTNFNNGFRNRDIRQLLFENHTQEEIKKQSAKVSRLLRILKSHGLIKKISNTHRYQLTAKGIELITAVKTVKNVNICDLEKLAA